MSQHGWHVRSPTTEHYQWFRNLGDLHALTVSWMKELHPDESPDAAFKLTRVQTPGLEQMLERLNAFTHEQIQPSLDELLGERTPNELLKELEKIVCSIQAWTLSNILEKTDEAELEPLANLLERSSFEAGRRACEQRWKSLPETQTSDIRSILTLCRDSPFAGFPHLDAFLIQRATEREMRVELLQCPHQSPYWEVRECADDLCALQVHWIRGFTYGLNTRTLIEHDMGSESKRCIQRWSFITEQSTQFLADHFYTLL